MVDALEETEPIEGEAVEVASGVHWVKGERSVPRRVETLILEVDSLEISGKREIIRNKREEQSEPEMKSQ